MSVGPSFLERAEIRGGGSAVGRLIEQVGEQHWLVAVGAGAAEAEGSAKAVAVGATTLAKIPFSTRRALVEAVREQIGPSLELGHQHRGIRGREVDLTKAVSALLAGVRTVAGAAGRQRGHADEAARFGASAGL